MTTATVALLYCQRGQKADSATMLVLASAGSELQCCPVPG